MSEEELNKSKEELKKILREINVENRKLKKILNDNYKINNKIAYEEEINEIILHNEELINKI